MDARGEHRHCIEPGHSHGGHDSHSDHGSHGGHGGHSHGGTAARTAQPDALKNGLIAAALCGSIPVMLMQAMPGAPATWALMAMQSFAAGGLLGDVFLHMMAHMPMSEGGHDHDNPTWKAMLGGIFAFLAFDIFLGMAVPKCTHAPGDKAAHKKQSSFTAAAAMSLFGDAMHNFMDGVALYIAFAVSYPLGVSTLIAVMAHEFPHEVGDFAVLMANGFSHTKASLYQMLTALAMFGGCWLASWTEGAHSLEGRMLPFVAGTMMYLALCTLLSEVNNSTTSTGCRLLNLATFGMGIGAMQLVTVIEASVGLAHDH